MLERELVLREADRHSASDLIEQGMRYWPSTVRVAIWFLESLFALTRPFGHLTTRIYRIARILPGFSGILALFRASLLGVERQER